MSRQMTLFGPGWARIQVGSAIASLPSGHLSRQQGLRFRSASTASTSLGRSARRYSSVQHEDTHGSYSRRPNVRHPETGQLLSRVAGSTASPLVVDKNLSQWWSMLVARHAHRPALISAHEPPDAHERVPANKAEGNEECLRWTFAEFDTHVRRLASGLLKLGIQKGDRVAVLMMWVALSCLAVWLLLNRRRLLPCAGIARRWQRFSLRPHTFAPLWSP